MNIAIISKSNRYAGGASKVAEDLALWLNEEDGFHADHFIAFPEDNLAPFQKRLYGSEFNTRLCKSTHKFTSKLGFREILPVEYWFNLHKVIDEYDIIHFHDLFLSTSPITLALAARRKPTFFTVHDCSAFTGGCLYPMGCDKFISNCRQCPQLGQDTWKQRVRDRSKEIQSIKRYITNHFDIRYIFPSNWIAQQAAMAMEFKIPPVVVPNGVDLEPFQLNCKNEAKDSFHIPEQRLVVMIVAVSLNDERKGVAYAVEAIQSIRDLNPLVIMVGNPSIDLQAALQGIEIMAMGFISDALLMARVYAASDVVLFCSLADNLPLTILEAMAASTVVVGFDTGGVPDMIKSGHNGILVEPKNQDALNQALRKVLLSKEILEMSRNARYDVEKYFSKSIFLKYHIQMYREVLSL
ncbi:MAG: glycosyl transferase group 1 [Oscillatoriales cyanobacterium CG2_30_44_21]|nr:MAG: glycosyl transferase group 1 [Oscillatoriales cyanobacterium CG2_30_44_21]